MGQISVYKKFLFLQPSLIITFYIASSAVGWQKNVATDRHTHTHTPVMLKLVIILFGLINTTAPSSLSLSAYLHLVGVHHLSPPLLFAGQSLFQHRHLPLQPPYLGPQTGLGLKLRPLQVVLDALRRNGITGMRTRQQRGQSKAINYTLFLRTKRRAALSNGTNSPVKDTPYT